MSMATHNYSFITGNTTAELEYAPQYFTYMTGIVMIMSLLTFHDFSTWHYVFRDFGGASIDLKNGLSYFGKAGAIVVPVLTWFVALTFAIGSWWAYNDKLYNAEESPLTSIWNKEFQYPKDTLAMTMTFGSFATLTLYNVAVWMFYSRVNKGLVMRMILIANTISVYGFAIFSLTLGYKAYVAGVLWTNLQLDVFFASGLILVVYLAMVLLSDDNKSDGIEETKFFHIIPAFFGLINIFSVNKVDGEMEDSSQYSERLGLRSGTDTINNDDSEEVQGGYLVKNGLTKFQYGPRFMNILGTVPVNEFGEKFTMAFVLQGLLFYFLIYADQVQASGAFLVTFLLPYFMSVISGGSQYFPAYFTVAQFYFWTSAYFMSGLGYNEQNFDPNEQVMLLNRVGGDPNAASGNYIGVTVTTLAFICLGSSVVAFGGRYLVGTKQWKDKSKTS